MTNDDPREQTEWATRALPGSEASVFIQWKGTQLCMDFECPCGAGVHIDDSFAYFVRCTECESVFQLGQQVMVRRIAECDAYGEPRNMFP